MKTALWNRLARVEALLEAADERTRLTAAMAILKATALQNTGRPSGATRVEQLEAEWRLNQLLSKW